MRGLSFALAASLLASPVLAALKPAFDPAVFVKEGINIQTKTALTNADWSLFNAAYAKCASSRDGAAFVSCVNAQLKNANAHFTVVKKG